MQREHLEGSDVLCGEHSSLCTTEKWKGVSLCVGAGYQNRKMGRGSVCGMISCASKVSSQLYCKMETILRTVWRERSLSDALCWDSGCSDMPAKLGYIVNQCIAYKVRVLLPIDWSPAPRGLPSGVDQRMCC